MTVNILDVLLILAVGAPVAWLSERLKFPNAVAQVVLGVLFGSAVLGWVGHSPALHFLGEVGVVLLLGVAGVELGFHRLVAAGWSGVAVGVLGILLSLLGGFGVGKLFGSPNEASIFLGLALAATSIGITVQILEQYGLIGRRVADIVIAAAVIDDVVALYLLGVAHGVMAEGLSALAALRYLLFAGLALAILFVIGQSLTRLAIRLNWLASTTACSIWGLLAIAFGAVATSWLGLSLVVGAFFAGVAVGEGIGKARRQQCVVALKPLVWVLMPFFFVMIGVQAQWQALTEPALFGYVSVLIVVAVISKAAGGLIVGLPVKGWRERWIVAFGMVPRGEVGLIVATLAFGQGHISESLFVVIVLATIAASVLGPLLLAPVASRYRKAPCNP